MRNVPIRAKLFLTVLALAVPALILVGVLAYLGGEAAVTHATFEHLTSVRVGKARQISSYLQQIRAQAETSSENRMIVEAMREFRDAHRTLHDAPETAEERLAVFAYYTSVFLPRLDAQSDEKTPLVAVLPEDGAALHLQHAYIAANPHPVDEKDLLVSTADDSLYDAVHRKYHPILRDFMNEFGYYDLFLIDTEGHIVYSVSKETDFATSLLDGPYRESNLAAVFAEVIDAVAGDTVRVADFAAYDPSYGAPASFIATPIDDGAERLGVLAFQMPVGEIDRVMTGDGDWRAEGLGETGETYLVGQDFRMRSNSRFILEDPEGFLAAAERAGASPLVLRQLRAFGTTILLQEADIEATRAALAGDTATRLTTDYRGQPVLSSYAPLDFEGVRWAVISEIDAAEALAPIHGFTRNLVLGLAGLLLVVLLASWVLSRRFVAPILALDDAARLFATGQDRVELPVSSGDEVGRLTRSFNQMIRAITNQTNELKKTNEELEGISSVIMRWGPDGAIRFMNDYGLQLFGFSREELVGQPLVGSIVPESDDVLRSIQRMIKDIAANPQDYENDETENQHKSGEWIWMAWRNRPILNDDGSLREILTIGIDISERKRAESQLRKLSRAVEQSSSSVVITDLAGDIEYTNPKFTEITGYALEEVVGQNPRVLKSGSQPQEFYADLWATIASGREWHGEFCNRKKNGELYWESASISPIRDASREITHYVAIKDDITERKRFEQALKDSEQRIRSMVDNMPGVVYRCLMDDDWTMLFISDEIENLSGYPPADFLGDNPKRSFASIMHPDDREPIAENALAAINERRPYTNEYRVIDRDGVVHWVYARGQGVFDGEGEVQYLDGTIFDVTEKKTMELQLADAKDAAEAANRAKSTFLANMSHELRTPMNAIIGYSEMLAEDAEDEGHDEMIPDLEKINTAGKHLLSLINDILDLSKIEAGRMDLYLERFDLRLMLDEAVATVAPVVVKNDNELVTDFGEDLGSIRADLTKLRQSIFNLLSNAAKFTESGTVTLAARRERREDGEWITLSVSDTGIGINEDKLEHVFEEFSQADDATTRDFGGTGLGLPISRRFCRMMGGDITVTSEHGAGCTFTIELPAQVDAIEAARASARADQPVIQEIQPGVRPILVIDDDPDSRDLLLRTLEADGYVVVTASSGDEGLSLARQLKPALITLDVMMPGTDGWAVLEQLKADPELRDVPVMIVSIVGEKDLGYTLGAVEYLTKPVDRDSLRQLVKQYTGSSEGRHALVVDDDSNIRSLFRRALEEDGWTVAEAENGSLALDRAAELKPDLVLLDLMMPVMDGFEFVLHFRNMENCASTPIIVVTAKDLTHEDRQRLVGGVERIVEKGALTRQQLLVQVRDLVARHNVPVEAGQNSADSIDEPT
jgi:PAS domain S-box-containing protein